MLLGVFCRVPFAVCEGLPCFWKWWSGGPRERELVRGQKYPGRQSEMVGLRNRSVKNLDFLLFILFTFAGLEEKWVGTLN